MTTAVSVREEDGSVIVWGWTFWLPPTEGHLHEVFMGGYDEEQVRANPVAGNGMTVRQNIFNRLHRYWAAGVPLQARTGHVPSHCICTRCKRLELLATATVALHEGRMATYHRLLEEIREMG